MKDDESSIERQEIHLGNLPNPNAPSALCARCKLPLQVATVNSSGRDKPIHGARTFLAAASPTNPAESPRSELWWKRWGWGR